MTPATHRYLGFAFACADLLIEVAEDSDEITFAVGAAAALAGKHRRGVGRALVAHVRRRA